LVPDVHENRADFVLKKIHHRRVRCFDDAIKRSNREKERDDDDPMTRSFFLLQILLSFFIKKNEFIRE